MKRLIIFALSGLLLTSRSEPGAADVAGDIRLNRTAQRMRPAISD